MTMTFEQFRTDVEAWATESGIYERSTALAQALRAVSVAGELADAVIKNDRDALIDSIGDMALRIVVTSNMLGFTGINPVKSPWSEKRLELIAAQVAVQCGELVIAIEHGELVRAIGYGYPSPAWNLASDTIYDLCEICNMQGLDFEACCDSALSEIKARKEFLSAAGVLARK